MKKEPKITKFETMALMNWAKEKNLTPTELEALVDIIGATGNETVAIELLLGVYEPIKISKTPAKKMNYDNRTLFVFLDFDRFTGTITYGYNRIDRKNIWKLKTDPKPAFADITPEMEEYSSSAQARKRDMTESLFVDLYERVTIEGPVDDTKLLEGICDLKDWQ